MAALLRLRGLNATGVLDVVQTGGAPRGSLYHHFPGGKEQLAEEAVLLARDTVERWIERAASVEEFLERYAGRLERTEFRDGCPVAAVALEGAPTSERLRAACAGALNTWRAALARRLEAAGHDRETAAGLATIVLCAFEGALVLARAERSAAPLREVIARLGPLLQPASQV
jgi:TetR/AcrR family transcriptional repressor of lmrAB and yxaGH operons